MGRGGTCSWQMLTGKVWHQPSERVQRDSHPGKKRLGVKAESKVWLNYFTSSSQFPPRLNQTKQTALGSGDSLFHWNPWAGGCFQIPGWICTPDPFPPAGESVTFPQMLPNTFVTFKKTQWNVTIIGEQEQLS
ncbi:unnamed protein product [Lepidochelys kempii]